MALSKVPEDIRNRLNHPGWKPLCDAILKWAFAEPREVIRRSNLLAQLLSKLTGQVIEIDALRQGIVAQVSQLRQASVAATEALDRVERVLSLGWTGPRALAELLMRLGAAREFFCDSSIEQSLAEIARVEEGIHAQLETFLQSVGRK